MQKTVLTDAEKLVYANEAAATSDVAVAKKIGRSPRTVADWRRKFGVSSNIKSVTSNANVSTESLTSQVATPVGVVSPESHVSVEHGSGNDSESIKPEPRTAISQLQAGLTAQADCRRDNLGGWVDAVKELPRQEAQSILYNLRRLAEKMEWAVDGREDWLAAGKPGSNVSEDQDTSDESLIGANSEVEPLKPDAALGALRMSLELHNDCRANDLNNWCISIMDIEENSAERMMSDMWRIAEKMEWALGID